MVSCALKICLADSRLLQHPLVLQCRAAHEALLSKLPKPQQLSHGDKPGGASAGGGGAAGGGASPGVGQGAREQGGGGGGCGGSGLGPLQGRSGCAANGKVSPVATQPQCPGSPHASQPHKQPSAAAPAHPGRLPLLPQYDSDEDHARALRAARLALLEAQRQVCARVV